MEREFAILHNHFIDEKTRGLAAIELFQKGKIRIYADSIDIKDIIKLYYLADHLGHVTVEKFVGRIIKSIDNKKLYCRHKWYIEEINNI